MHQLSDRALERLVTLGGSQYTTVPGSRNSLMLLGGIVESASSAAAALAFAVACNQMSGDQPVSHRYPGSETDHQADRARHHTGLHEQFNSAGRLLRRCATDCHNITRNILRSLLDHPEHRPALPDLTPAQYRALEKIAKEGAVYTRSLRGDRESVRAGDGSTIHSKPFRVLQAHQLVRLSKDSSRYASVDVTATTAGRLALNTQRPARTPVSASAKAASPGAPSAGRRR
ncbi:hypothetical protein ACFUCQ_02810 [Streptomyces sp. NPDC057197]|uniref:hypothetical protein n=1 Tax=Streptomyces sp. NPDC057197 TaxID=3346045 RepID=UPI003634281A